MELELGLKLTRAADEFTSDFQIAKERGGPVFVSRETDTMFILTAHLKGYRKGNIKIDINEDGTLIAISGERQVSETVMVGWKVYKKDAEIKGFKKVFRIPYGVILDDIKAKFNDESSLTITMPKKAKGIQGTAIEEIEENSELVKDGSGNLHILDEKVQTTDTSEENKKDEMLSETHAIHKNDDVQKLQEDRGTKSSTALESFPPVVTRINGEENLAQKSESEIQEIIQTQQDKEHDQQQTTDQEPNETDNIQEDKNANEDIAEAGQEREHTPVEKNCKMCIPIIAGSTILLSFVVFVIQMIRSKNQAGRRRD